MGAAQHDTLPIDRRYTPGLEALSRPSTDMLKFRQQFMVKMGWFDESHTDDRDRYDGVLSTVHLMERDEHGDILSGMRLTRLGSLDESLSVQMLEGNSSMHEAAVVFGKTINYAQTDLWDLTRLVHQLEGEANFVKSVESAQAIFGAGLAKTRPEDGRELLWVFTTTELIKGFLDISGIKTEPVAQGKLRSDDEKDSYFRAIHPVTAMQFLQDNQAIYGRTYDSVSRGYQALAAYE